MDRFASCAKSAVSIDEQLCNKQGCIQLKKHYQQLCQCSNAEDNVMTNKQQLINQISRIKRKLVLSQKSKNILADELSLVKQQLEIATKKIKNMREVKKINQELTISQITVCQSDVSQKIVIKEKEQQIDMLITQIKEKNRQIECLKSLNTQLGDQIYSKNNIIAKIKESSVSQINFYRRQISQLEETLESKKGQLQKRQKNLDKLIEREKQEWNKMSIILKNQLVETQQELDKCQAREMRLVKAIKEMQLKIKQQYQQLKNQKQENKWLKELIQQAKIQYIHSQLVKLETKDKITKDMQDKKKRSKIQQINKHLKSHTDMPIAIPSAKTQRNSNCSYAFLAPFKFVENQLNLNQPQPSTSERNPFNQF